MHNFQFFDVILLALLTGFIAFRLYTVLGRRTGHERSPDDQLRLPDGARPNPTAPPVKDNVVTLPERTGPASAGATANPAQRGLLDIKLSDRSFDTDRFLGGARAAYEMIVTAFARGEREALRPLLSDDVFEIFDHEIQAREAKKERVDFTFLSLKSARITGAEMKNQVAEVTVTFESEIMLAGYDPAGTLIEGDAKTPHQVTEVWTFARDTRASDPNWTLVSTASHP
ncbi:MAG TPA: Tim44/TimA family putative adaptor protein [Micropepsaceae bacterium]|jgi:predicted lipid-binding transport protein (Tim44 family)|nr:Tim44/TimA family putative adaptor protein [Micropepsaceae bacterium]